MIPSAPAEVFSPAEQRRIEDASLNASAPPQQRWIDGWLVRTSPGKAKRARCIQPVAPGFRAVEERLATCEAVFREAGLPMLFRITPFAEPAGLDELLQTRGWHRFDETLVMALPLDLSSNPGSNPILNPAAEAADHRGEPQSVSALDFARTVGALRGSPPGEIEAHAERLRLSPVPVTPMVWHDPQARVLAAGQFTREQSTVGLYDIHVASEARRQGLGSALCRHLLAQAATEGARMAYLQVEAGNLAAQSIYRRMGFVEIYRYHYRSAQVGDH